MKIAFVYDCPYPWSTGGIEVIKNKEAEELAKDNEIHFFTMQWKGMHKTTIRNNVIYHAWYPASATTIYKKGKRSLMKAIAFSLGMVRLFKYRFDVVVIDQFPYLHIPIVLLYSKLTGCKLIMEVSEVWDKKYWQSYLGTFGLIAYKFTRFFVRYADIYITNSSTTKTKLHSLGIDKNKIKIFAPVIVEKEIEITRKNIKEKSLRIIFSGRFVKEKRIDKWINVIKLISRRMQGIEGIIIGEGVEKDKIVKLIKKNNLEKVITIKPFFKDKKTLYNYIAKSSIFLNMSEREGLSIITIESLLLGTTVILPTYSPIPKEIKSKCIVCKEEEIPNKILNILINYRTTPTFTTRLLKQYSSSNIIHFFSELYDELDRGHP